MVGLAASVGTEHVAGIVVVIEPAADHLAGHSI